MLLGLQSLTPLVSGFTVLAGYIEWHLSNVITLAAQSEQWTDFEIFLASTCMWGLVYVIGQYWFQSSHATSSINLVCTTLSLISVNSVVRWTMNYIQHAGPADGVSVLIVVIIFVKTINHIIVVSEMLLN